MKSVPASAAARRPSPFFIVDESDDYVVAGKPPFIEIHPSKPGGRPTFWDSLRDLLAFEIVNGGQI
ncbi:MAG TPA: hypothetical protein VFV83_10720, partial [Chthoniobacteraceae bacterium]|nr:hypothetical protein [Chthoniobacteraceae bacterium]